MQVQDFNFLWTLLEKNFNKPNFDQDWATIEQISQVINLVNWSVSEVLQIPFDLVLKCKKKITLIWLREICQKKSISLNVILILSLMLSMLIKLYCQLWNIKLKNKTISFKVNFDSRNFMKHVSIFSFSKKASNCDNFVSGTKNQTENWSRMTNSKLLHWKSYFNILLQRSNWHTKI